MSLAGKIFSVIALVAAVFYTGITAALVSLQENYRKQLVKAKAEHRVAIQAKDNEIADLNVEAKNLSEKLATTQRELARAIAEANEMRAEWEEAAAVNRYAMAIIRDQEDQIATLSARVDGYNDDLKSQRDANDKLQARIGELEGERDRLLAERDKLQDLLKVREVDLTNATKEVEKLTTDLSAANDLLAKLKDTRPDIYDDLIRTQPLQPEKIIRGKVIGVEKKLGLVVLNVGQRHDVRKGYRFIVFRGSQYVGKVIVDEVFPDMAAAHYDRGSMKTDVEVGDDVTTKLAVEL